MNQSIPLKGLRTTGLRDPLPSAFDRDTGLTITGLRAPARRLKPETFDYGKRAQVHTQVEFIQPPIVTPPPSQGGITDNYVDIDAGEIEFVNGLAKSLTPGAQNGWYGNIVWEHTDAASVTHWITASITNGRIVSVSYDGTIVTGTQATPGTVSLVSADTT